MTDKKIVDDYYSQNIQEKNEAQDSDKKPKISIKWKLKIKKEETSQDEVSSQNKKDSNVQSEISQKPKEEKVKPKKIHNSFAQNYEEKPKESTSNDERPKRDFTPRNDQRLNQSNWTQRPNFERRDQNSYQRPAQSSWWQRPNFERRDQNSSQRPNQSNWTQRANFERRDQNSSQRPNQNNWTTRPNFERRDQNSSQRPSQSSSWNYEKRDTNTQDKFPSTFGWPKKDFNQGFKSDFVAWKKKVKKDFSEWEERKSKFFKNKDNKYSKNIFLEDDDSSFSRSNKIKQVKKEEKKVEDIKQNLVDRTWETIIVWDILSLKEFSEKIWVPIPKLIAEFLKNWMKVTLNSKIDFDTASIISDSFQVKLQKDTSSWFSVEDLLTWNIQSLLIEQSSENLEPRPPVISIMWHVDHWKTSLLDYIRKTKVADKEAGWITQSIWAYQVEYNDKKITFLDTPWHEAFTIMRARWAKSTDIAVLVVAADEWVKPQTIESINHAKEANIQIIVAITKIDKPGANLDNVKSWLSGHWIISSDWWGEVSMVWVSAKTWEWVDELLELITLQAEILELKANPQREAIWTVLESHLDMKLWPVSTVLINTWTLNKWDCIVCKWAYWRVKVLKDHIWKNVNSATLSQPVLVVWLDSVTEWWDIVQVVSDIEKARVKALEYKELMSSKKALSSSSIDMIMSKIKSWNLKQLKIVLKSDTNWSLEAIKWALLKLSTPETKVTIIHSWVWNITEWDVLMCQWSSAILIWYNVEVLGTSKNLIEDKKIEYISSKIIYHITERVEKIVTWMLDPKEVEAELGNAEVGWIFFEDKEFSIVWLKLAKESKILKNCEVRIIREWKIIWKWHVENLKSWIVDVVDLEWPTECWIKLKSDVKVLIKDQLEIYKIEIQK